MAQQFLQTSIESFLSQFLSIYLSIYLRLPALFSSSFSPGTRRQAFQLSSTLATQRSIHTHSNNAHTGHFIRRYRFAFHAFAFTRVLFFFLNPVIPVISQINSSQSLHQVTYWGQDFFFDFFSPYFEEIHLKIQFYGY